jgi:phosphoglycolate phosphatase
VIDPTTFDWRQFDAFLFDIDGTLLNAQGGVHYNSFHTALREIYGCDGRIDGVAVHGNTDIGILRAALQHHGVVVADFEARLPQALELMSAEVERKADNIKAEICPSILDLLAELRRDDKLLGVATGNLERIGWIKLERAGLRQFFQFGSFSDRNEKREDIFRQGFALARKLRGAETSVCVVGDTPNDIQAAAQVDLPVIAVATGVYSLEELRKYQPSLVVETCTELLSMALR